MLLASKQFCVASLVRSLRSILAMTLIYYFVCLSVFLPRFSLFLGTSTQKAHQALFCLMVLPPIFLVVLSCMSQKLSPWLETYAFIVFLLKPCMFLPRKFRYRRHHISRMRTDRLHRLKSMVTVFVISAGEAALPLRTSCILWLCLVLPIVSATVLHRESLGSDVVDILQSKTSKSPSQDVQLYFDAQHTNALEKYHCLDKHGIGSLSTIFVDISPISEMDVNDGDWTSWSSSSGAGESHGKMHNIPELMTYGPI